VPTQSLRLGGAAGDQRAGDRTLLRDWWSCSSGNRFSNSTSSRVPPPLARHTEPPHPSAQQTRLLRPLPSRPATTLRPSRRPLPGSAIRSLLCGCRWVQDSSARPQAFFGATSDIGASGGSGNTPDKEPKSRGAMHWVNQPAKLSEVNPRRICGSRSRAQQARARSDQLGLNAQGSRAAGQQDGSKTAAASAAFRCHFGSFRPAPNPEEPVSEPPRSGSRAKRGELDSGERGRSEAHQPTRSGGFTAL
jgi:hypothetical protein